MKKMVNRSGSSRHKEGLDWSMFHPEVGDTACYMQRQASQASSIGGGAPNRQSTKTSFGTPPVGSRKSGSKTYASEIPMVPQVVNQQPIRTNYDNSDATYTTLSTAENKPKNEPSATKTVPNQRSSMPVKASKEKKAETPATSIESYYTYTAGTGSVGKNVTERKPKKLDTLHTCFVSLSFIISIKN